MTGPGGKPLATYLALAGLTLAAWGLRLHLLRTTLSYIEADEAIVGLMGRHILGGEWPVFYYGQPYLGSLEAYLVALAFALAGPSAFTLKLVPLACSLLTLPLAYLLGRELAGDYAGLGCAAYLGLGPAFLHIWSLKARGGYIETLVLGQAILFLALTLIYKGRRELWRFWLLGLLAGLAFWTHAITLPFIVAPGLLYLYQRERKASGRALLLAALGFAIGCLPFIVYNVQTGGASFQAFLAGGTTLRQAARNLRGFMLFSLPILLGFLQPSTAANLMAAQLQARPVLWLAGILAGFLLLGYIFFSQRHVLLRGRRPADLLLAAFLITILLVNGTSFGVLTQEPRYALPLYATLPLAATRAGDGWRGRVWTGVLVALLALNLAVTLTLDPHLNLPTVEGRPLPFSVRPLAAWLQERGISRVYADYWIAYPLIFESGEEVIASVTSGGYNRYVPYAYLVSVAERPAHVFLAGSGEERFFAARLERERVTYRRAEVGGYSIYYELSRKIEVEP
jgi:4-amino-4-deoxy-L-arabinose transferase-like glycosyltransferase